MDPELDQRLSRLERMVDDIQTVVHQIQKSHAEEHQLNDVESKLDAIQRAIQNIN